MIHSSSATGQFGVDSAAAIRDNGQSAGYESLRAPGEVEPVAAAPVEAEIPVDTGPRWILRYGGAADIYYHFPNINSAMHTLLLGFYTGKAQRRTRLVS